jgi:Tfp pilus assembly protein PilF
MQVSPSAVRRQCDRALGFCFLVLFLCLCGCHEDVVRKRLPVFGPEAWENEVRRQGIDPDTLDYPLDYTDEMQKTASAAAGPVGSTSEKLGHIQDYLFGRKLFNFSYEVRETHTAIEAFDRRSGNCVSFTSLFIALTRSVDLPVQAALLTYPDSIEQEGDLVVVRNHIAAAYERGEEMLIFDFSRTGKKRYARAELLDDMGVTALYLNNLGSEELFAGNEEEALRYFDTAVKLAPEYTPTYANLGVVRRRLGDIDGALAAYHQALRIDVRQPTVLNNLAALYHSQGRLQEASDAVRAADPRGAIPNLLVVRGNIELVEGKPKVALNHFKRAARLDPEAAEPRVAIARAQLARGHAQAARKALLAALERDPENQTASEMLAENDWLD